MQLVRMTPKDTLAQGSPSSFICGIMKCLLGASFLKTLHRNLDFEEPITNRLITKLKRGVSWI